MGSLLAGGLVTAGAAPAHAAAAAPRLVRAKALRGGDLIVGPDATVVRVHSRRRLSSGRIRIRYTDPATGGAARFDAASDARGFPRWQKFVVLTRGVPAGAVRLTGPTDGLEAPTGGDTVIDGGGP